MTVRLPAHSLCGNEPMPIEFPDSWDVHVHSFKGQDAPAMTQAQVVQAIRAPKGAVPIAEGAKGCRDAVIIIDDITRPTPCAPIARAVIAELEAAGVPRDKIRFVVALGMHRAMGREEFVRKLDEELVTEFCIYNHNAFFNNVQLGLCGAGIPIELNAECVAADYKIGIGSVFPHFFTGIGGGGKLIVPGIASAETIRRYHTMPGKRWSLDMACRQLTLDAAELLGLNFKVDAMLNGAGELARLFVGNCRDNVEQNVDEIKDFYSVTPPKGPADVLIANNYFKATEPNVGTCYPQIYSLVKPGGTLIASTHTPIGAADHYLFGRWGDSGIGGLSYVGEAKLPERIGQYIAYTKYLTKGIALTYHFDPSDGRLKWATSWQQVMDLLGREKKSVIIFPYATVTYFRPEYNDEPGPIMTVGQTQYTQL